MRIFTKNKSTKTNNMNYFHLLRDANGDIVEMYVNFNSKKNFGLLSKCEQFGWTYELNAEE